MGRECLMLCQRQSQYGRSSHTHTADQRCTVINRAIARTANHTADWDTGLHLPPMIPPTERSQIEEKLESWVDALCVRPSTHITWHAHHTFLVTLCGLMLILITRHRL